jgi:hypothetical protein
MGKTITIRFYQSEDMPDPVLGDYGKISPDQIAILLAQPHADPRILTDEDITRAADGIAANEYRDTLQGIVEDLKRAIVDGEVTDRDGAMDWLHDTIDGHHDVIYTACAREVCNQSRNEDAYADQFGPEGIVEDGAIQWSRLAYCALEADVLEAIGNLDEWFQCSVCNGDVEPEDLKIAGDDLPTCADCRGDEDEDKSEPETDGSV